MENLQRVILQGHMYMVPQANKNVKHNFETDPIVPRIVDDWVMATDTTLGADNGIGVSTILAVLEATDLPHGPIEALITRDEETGMYGAKGLEPETLKGKILLNLDSEDDAQLFIGCAGGIDTTSTFHYTLQAAKPGYHFVRLNIKGLNGGHSGSDIHLGRGNANKILARFLWQSM